MTRKNFFPLATWFAFFGLIVAALAQEGGSYDPGGGGGGSGTVASGSQYYAGCYLTAGTTISACPGLTINGFVIGVGNPGNPGTLQIYGASYYSQILASTTGSFAFTLPPSAANDTLVGAAATQALTNKTISGASNTLTNIDLGAAVTGLLPIGNGGTGQTTASAAYAALAPSPTRAGDVQYWNGLAWASLAGNNAGTNCFQENASGVPSWGPCSGGGTALTIGSTATSGGAAAGALMFDSAATTGVLQENAKFTVDTTNFAYDVYRNCLTDCVTNSEQVFMGFTSSIVATAAQTVANTPTAVWQVTKNGSGTGDAGGAITQRNFGFFVGPTSATANLIFDYGLTTTGALTFGYNGTANICMFNTGWCWNKSTLAMVGSAARPIGWTSAASTPTGSPDTTMCRQAAGVVEIGSGSGCAANGAVQLAALQAVGGTAPTLTTGTCAGSSWTGGSTVGRLTTATGCATGQTIVISGLPASTNGYVCHLQNRTTPTSIYTQTGDSTTSATLTEAGTGANNDVLYADCIGY